MVNHVDLPTLIERFGKVFFRQSCIRCWRDMLHQVTSKREHNHLDMGIFVLFFHLPIQWRVWHLRLPISYSLFTSISIALPCHEQKTQGTV